MWHQVRKTRKYRDLVSAIADTAPKSKEQKALYKERTKLLESYGFTSVSFGFNFIVSKGNDAALGTAG